MNARLKPTFGILLSICVCHAINDMLQSLLAAVYPTLQAEFHLSFAQIGLVTLTYQITASMLQPAVGLYADLRPTPFSLPIGTLFTFAGLVALSLAGSYPALIAGACVLGVGSSVFHPEASRVARMASGGRPGFAQSVFQVGGAVGSALGPVGAALVVAGAGQRSLGSFAGAALVSTVILTRVGIWYARHGLSLLSAHRRAPVAAGASLAAGRVGGSLAVLLLLIFSKYVYLAGFSNYYTFYLMHRFGVSVQRAQMHLFAFSVAVAAGTLAGGPLGDRFGRKHVIWFSILGVLPFTIALPHVDLAWTGALTVLIGFIIASAFPAIVVYGQELLPSREGMIAGLFFGLSFGAAGVGAAVLGRLADGQGIEAVYRVCAFLPAMGVLAAALPDLGGTRRVAVPAGARDS
jgi:FSR family fosmidomycin resistance protein-like MFS transporter